MTVLNTSTAAAVPPDGTVVFLIGMRLNRPWKLHRWLPPFVAMPRMLAELRRHPERGLLGAHIWFGRTTVVLQYWRGMADLMAYARAGDGEHLPAWRAFNRRARGGAGDVGIWHEAYVVRGAESHVVYRDMPAFGLAAAVGQGPASSPARLTLAIAG